MLIPQSIDISPTLHEIAIEASDVLTVTEFEAFQIAMFDIMLAYQHSSLPVQIGAQRFTIFVTCEFNSKKIDFMCIFCTTIVKSLIKH